MMEIMMEIIMEIIMTHGMSMVFSTANLRSLRFHSSFCIAHFQDTRRSETEIKEETGAAVANGPGGFHGRLSQ